LGWNEDGSGPEPYLGEELTGEHEIAEGGAVRAVPEKDGFHGGIGQSRSAGSSTRGQMLEDCQYIAGSDGERGGLGNGE
jgi:hypothetical protein